MTGVETRRRIGGLPGAAKWVLIGLGALLFATGCAVPQPRGKGNLARVVEPTTKRGYWLYQPAGYVQADPAARKQRRWPVVVTFHGMKPFDNAHPQALEWESEADRYGFFVVAPELRAFDVLAEFPIRRVTPLFRSDEEAVLAILDHVDKTTGADLTNVLSTSWSSGGYMAHYMVNRHPDRFSCLAVRQSNFSREIQSTARLSQTRDHPILILNTQNDFAICKEESKEAIRWYEQQGFRNMAWAVIKALGHERTPDLAADFFAHAAGVRPERARQVSTRRQVIQGNARGLAMLSGQEPASTPQPAAPRVARKTRVSTPANTTSAARRAPTPPRYAMAPASEPARAQTSFTAPPTTTRPEPRVSPVVRRVPRSATPARSYPSANNQPPASATSYRAPRPTTTPPRAAAIPSIATQDSDANIRVSAAIGIEPLHLGFSAECPASWRHSAKFYWTLDGEPIGDKISGHRTISRPGEYTLGLRVVDTNGGTHAAQRLIRVIPRRSE